MKRYSIKEVKAKVFKDQDIEFDLRCDGEWLETFKTRDLADEEQNARVAFDLSLGKRFDYHK